MWLGISKIIILTHREETQYNQAGELHNRYKGIGTPKFIQTANLVKFFHGYYVDLFNIFLNFAARLF